MRSARCVSDLFQYHNHQVQQVAVDEIQRTGGKGVLLLFEGYDELPETMRIENSIFLDVVTGRELPDATVLVTSRHWASEFLHRECKRRISHVVEIVGFTSANIQSYLESTCSDDPQMFVGVKKYISFYPHINSMMYIPLNCAIVVEVYRNSKEDDNLVPKTMTELYSSLIRSLLLRYLFNHPEHGKVKWKVQCFDELPPDVYQQLRELSTIAYNGINNEQQVIFSGLPDNFETLGLMQCAPELYLDEGAAVSYNFLHLTIQEFLAAFHLSQQSIHHQIKYFLTKHVYSHFQMVLRFLAGLMKFRGYPIEIVTALCIQIEKCKNKSNIKSGEVLHAIAMNLHVLHCLFEVQHSDIISELLGSSLVHIREDIVRFLTPFDCFALGFCVSHSNCNWSISLPSCHIGDEGVELLVRGALEKETRSTGRITEINFSNNNLTNKSINHLLNLPKQMLNNLEVLSLCNNKLDSDSCATLTGLVPHVPTLEKLDLSCNRIKWGAADGLMASFIGHNSLKELSLPSSSVGSEGCQSLSKLLSTSKTIKKLFIEGLPALRHPFIYVQALLNIKGTKYRFGFSAGAVELVISGLQDNTSLEVLSMNGSHFSLENSIALASVLRTNHSLVCLYLVESNIDSDGVYHLANALRTNSTLQTLYLGSNRTGAEDANELAIALRSNRTLLELNLDNCNIHTNGAYSLATALHKNHTLKTLHLGCNPIKSEGAAAFASALRRNHALVHLDLCNCSIDANGAHMLASALRKNNTLQKLSLCCNPIRSEGAAAFASALRRNHALVYLDLCKCSIDSNGAHSLATALCKKSTLQHLNLSKNFINVKGAASFAKMVYKNKSLKTLHLSDTSIREEGAVKLVDSLNNNKTLESLWLSHKFNWLGNHKKLRYETRSEEEVAMRGCCLLLAKLSIITIVILVAIKCLTSFNIVTISIIWFIYIIYVVYFWIFIN